MTLTSFLLLVFIAAVCGALGQAFAGYSSRGCLVSTGMGFVGAWIGMWLGGALGLPTMLVLDVGGVDFPVVWSIIGSGLLVAVLGFLSPARR